MEIYSLSFFLLVSVGLILYYTVFSRCQWICLLGLSLLFFTASGWKGLVFLLFTALTIWLGGLQLAKLDADSAARRKAPGITKDEKKAIKAQAVRCKKCLVAAVLTANFLVLGYFKYWSYFAELLSGAFSATAPSSLGLVMPLGISFYTFSAGGYLIDVYRGTVAPERSLLTFGTYLTMFPKLVSGPIASYAQLQPEFGARDVSLRQAVDGLKLFVFGMALKILLANQLGGLWSDVTTIGFESLSTPLAWMAAFAYSFQLYFDFWGYSLMAIGIGRGEYFLSSDAASIIEYTQDFVYVNDGEIAVINRNKPLKIVTLDNHEGKIDIKKLQMSISQLEKGGYPHFMLKEIYEQPKTIVDCIRGRINPETGEVKLSGVIDNRRKFLQARRIIFVACGTSWHAALIGEHLIENICRIPVEVEYASEFRYRNPVIYEDDIVIAVSQSGDTLAAVELARKAGAFVFGICNVVGSSIARATHSGAYIHVGPEIGVASTKAFTGQVTVMAMLALAVGREKGAVTEEYYREVAKGLLELPAVLEEVLKLGPRIEDLSKIFTYAHNFIYLGRGYNYPTAMEGALKLKEISYIHAEGYPAAEMKHGAIALIDNEMPTVAIATPDNTYEKTASNIEEIRARGGKIIAVIARDDTHVRRSADYTIEVPVITDCLMPVVVSVPLQLLAYYIAVNKGRNVDQPRNLAKSVTVE